MILQHTTYVCNRFSFSFALKLDFIRTKKFGRKNEDITRITPRTNKYRNANFFPRTIPKNIPPPIIPKYIARAYETNTESNKTTEEAYNEILFLDDNSKAKNGTVRNVQLLEYLRMYDAIQSFQLRCNVQNLLYGIIVPRAKYRNRNNTAISHRFPSTMK